MYKFEKNSLIKKMLKIDQLSYWERTTYFEGQDLLIVGAGIVGLSTAIAVKKKYPHWKIVIVERGYLPSGASTKNAGFACFGSPSELFEDLKTIPENQVWETFNARYYGLKTLFELVDPLKIEYNACGSYDLLRTNDEDIDPDFIAYLNNESQKITKKEKTYLIENDPNGKFNFGGIKTAYFNSVEGSINTGKLIEQLHQKAIQAGISILFGMECQKYEASKDGVSITLSIGEMKVDRLIICSNGFASQLVDEDVIPARAQVLITKTIPKLSLDSTFHMDKGYYYFRSINNRILLGGGRNLDINGETTTDLATTEHIQTALRNILDEIIMPHQHVEIDYSWSGIMGVGKSKQPIVKKITDNVYVGIRMGGMGVAIGAAVGQQLSELID
jgi:glycine/D-amino acid oxidase-like deaminating enzyme